MRIDRVEAHAFGPFTDRALDFQPGLTVVHGPNESGKSSWHAAIYGGLCGLRHVGGRPLKEDQRYEERHRPWDDPDGAWHASVYVTLDDGRRIHFHGDLAGRNDYARDVDSGRDVVGELDLENDNAPDGARLLGLTRRTILATIQVRQADVLHVLEAPDGLQEHLQQAAATGGDTTAEGAISRLEEFHSQHVGTMHHASRRPLKAGHDRVEACEAELRRVRAAHEAYLELHRELDRARDEVAALERDVAAARAAAARQRLAELEHDHDRAAALQARLPADAPPPVEVDDRIEVVTDALAAWEHRPDEPSLPAGPTADELERELDELPSPPTGDTEPAEAVLDAASALDDARRRLRYHADEEPAPAPPPTAPAAAPVGRGAAWPTSRVVLVAGGGLLLVAGLVGLAVGSIAAGAGLGVVGAVALVVGLVRAPAAAQDAALVQRRLDEQARVTWQRRRDRLREEAGAGEQHLRAALSARGMQDPHDTDRPHDADRPRGPVDDLLARYEHACAQRAARAARADRRDELAGRLAARREAETAAARDRRRRREARQQLEEAAARVDVAGEDPDATATALRAWRGTARQEQGRRAAQRDDWTRLATLLDGRTLDDLAAQLDRARRELPTMPDGVDEDQARALAARRTELQQAAARAREHVAKLEGRIQDKEGDVDSVVEAEEALERARRELERVRALDDTLARTIGFLDEARTRVQRDIAPRLRQAVQRHLPRITLGRYRHVRVDPETLAVRVSADGTRWRDADRLSQGTAEQVYLLLRLAMAEHAVTTGETAPLLLDDVTVQSDRQRTERLLELLDDLSGERQVVLFTQERHVVEWARAHLPAEAVIELDPGAIRA